MAPEVIEAVEAFGQRVCEASVQHVMPDSGDEALMSILGVAAMHACGHAFQMGFEVALGIGALDGEAADRLLEDIMGLTASDEPIRARPRVEARKLLEVIHAHP